MKFSILSLTLIVILSNNATSQISISLSLLRSSGSGSSNTTYFLSEAGREGLFYYDAKDLNSADNGGTVIVSGSKRFKRSYSGPLDATWFGMKADFNGTSGTDNTAALNAAINGAAKGETVLIPKGSYYVKSTIALPLTTTKKVNLQIYGDIYFAKGSGFVVEGLNQDFRSYGLLAGGNTGATTQSAYEAYSGDGVYIKNCMNCYIEVNEVKDFRNGIHQSGDKNGGDPVGSQFNRIYFNSIHNNHTQIRISTKGTTNQKGNWNNESFWYGGQIGRGIPGSTYGKGGWYGLVFHKESGSNAGDPMNGHMFHDVGFEGVEKAIVMNNAWHNSFIGGAIEPEGARAGIDLDPVTCVGNKFIGWTYIEEHQFVAGRMGVNTVVEGTPLWSGTTNKVIAGNRAGNSVTPNKMLITTEKYTHTNFIVNKAHDLISQTGEYPTVQAMMYRINGVVRSVPFKGTYMYVKPSTSGSPLTLPPNIGTLRVEAGEAKVFKIDVGDLAAYGEEFIVEYLSPKFPISFVRSDNSTVLIASSNFPSGGTYRCLWTDGMYKVSKIGAEFRMFTQTGASYTISDGIETHYVNYPYGNATTTLPPAATWPGRQIIVKNLQAGKTVQVNGISASDENILPGRGAVTVKSDGVTWNIIGFYKRNLTY